MVNNKFDWKLSLLETVPIVIFVPINIFTRETGLKPVSTIDKTVYFIKTSRIATIPQIKMITAIILFNHQIFFMPILLRNLFTR